MDDLDKLLDFDGAVEEFLNDIPARNTNGNSNQNNAAQEQPRDEDQEVQVKKKRAPVPKLDEARYDLLSYDCFQIYANTARLLSDAGIPRLRKITKSRLKFRGKGHEFTDISRLLNTYQLWLDDLYPRAKFRDALAMVEKVGHSKRMQITRKAWLDDTKSSRRGLSPDPQAAGAEDVRDRESSIFGDLTEENPPANGDAPDGDELDALMEDAGANGDAPAKHSGPFGEDEPDDDELDALLAESAPNQAAVPAAAQPTTRRGPFEQDSDDEDELEALMAEQAASTTQSAKPPQNTGDSNDFADEEEVMASMGW